ncbi:MAG: RNA pyrophosphohydrolase [Rhodospirillales bacterium]|nr:RNA pyrophosphohydrolase [Rhodospirillales bacterium]MDH3909974.1 RNA pyrophosphohydrolase [Rhodospirillales bacterium]MDH3919064.1 RNA pyrophosphohydrolase [Rhodospirillales bacterium]MDH3969538.1 RNA pyrophosphohydrolase [Rhodospirillales bacterium]
MTTSPEEIARLPYRRGVGLMLLNRNNQVFVAQRIDTPRPAWQMPQGGIDEGETPRDAVLRELEEEIGTSKAEIIAESRRWFDYDLPRDLVPKVWHGRYRGQTQKWFALRFLGEDRDIDVETEEPEFSAWKWAAYEELPELIVPFKLQLYRAVLAEFAGLFELRADS